MGTEGGLGWEQGRVRMGTGEGWGGLGWEQGRVSRLCICS